MRSIKVLSFLLTYPSAAHQEVLPECMEILEKEKGLSAKALQKVSELCQWMESRPLLDVQEEYVDLFDRTPSLCLHLFEHIHGDSRERGQAMVDLDEIYKSAGLEMSLGEMPDFLPLFLEYLSTLPPEETYRNLGDVGNVLGAIGERLNKRQSHYASVFEALLEMADRKPDLKEIEEAVKKDSGKIPDLAEIDQQWEEQFAFENTDQTTGAGGCPAAEDMLRRINIPLTNDKTQKETV